jgi:alkyldihydroxyacetonephosphate synthase
VRVRRAPADRDYFMYAFQDFSSAVESARTLIQSGAAPALVRVADEEETAASLALGSRGGGTGLQNVAKRAVRKTIEWRLERLGIRPPAMATLLVGLEGTRDENRRLRRLVREQFRYAHCAYLGRTLGMRWLSTRFDLPYLRDELLDNHLLVDTLETATTWSRLSELYAAVREAIYRAAAAEGEPIVVFTHVSHLYRDGASLYFSLLGRQKRSDPIGQWRAIKRAAGDAIRAQGAVISHHHGVGQDHRDQTGRTPVEHKMLAQLKQALDPAGIMNPGKLL